MAAISCNGAYVLTVLLDEPSSHEVWALAQPYMSCVSVEALRRLSPPTCSIVCSNAAAAAAIPCPLTSSDLLVAAGATPGRQRADEPEHLRLGAGGAGGGGLPGCGDQRSEPCGPGCEPPYAHPFHAAILLKQSAVIPAARPAGSWHRIARRPLLAAPDC